MLTVACVLSGGSYHKGHVFRLADMIDEHLKQPHRFVCVDDSPFPGFWAKVSLFEPGRFTGRVFYLDLDVTVVGPVDELVTIDAPFIACPDWIRTRRRDGSLRRSRLNSSVMVWDAGACDHVFTEFHSAVMDRLEGDQDWIGERMNHVTLFPLGTVVSYKADVMTRGRIPPSARIVVYHGQPKPWSADA